MLSFILGNYVAVVRWFFFLLPAWHHVNHWYCYNRRMMSVRFKYLLSCSMMALLQLLWVWSLWKRITAPVSHERFLHEMPVRWLFPLNLYLCTENECSRRNHIKKPLLLSKKSIHRVHRINAACTVLTKKLHKGLDMMWMSTNGILCVKASQTDSGLCKRHVTIYLLEHRMRFLGPSTHCQISSIMVPWLYLYWLQK